MLWVLSRHRLFPASFGKPQASIWGLNSHPGAERLVAISSLGIVSKGLLNFFSPNGLVSFPFALAVRRVSWDWVPSTILTETQPLLFHRALSEFVL